MILQVDDDFASMIPPLSQEALSELETSLLADGCRDAIVVWGETIVDGHNRYSLCKKNSIEFLTRSMEFASRDEATTWILRNQIARRNLTPDQMSEVRGRLYNKMKADSSGCTSNDGKKFRAKSNAAKILAEATGVSDRTIRNDGDYASAVEKTGNRAGGDVSKQDVIAEATGGKKPKEKKSPPPRVIENDSTPPIETIHSLLGEIDPGADLFMLFKSVADLMDESTFEMAVEGVVGARGMKMIPRDTPLITATMVDTHQPWTVLPALIEKMGRECLESELKTAGYAPVSQTSPVVAPEARGDVPAEKPTSAPNPIPRTPDMAKSAIKGIIGLHRVTNVIGWIADLISEDESKKAGMVKLLRKHAKQIASTVSKEALEEDVPEPTLRKRFVIPAIPEIEQEIADKGYKNADAEKFWNYYDSVDWKVGKSLKPMKNWRSALRNWNSNNFDDKSQSKPSFKAAPSPILGKKKLLTAEQKREDLRRIYAKRNQEVPQSVLDAQKDDVDE